jgi:hypothetical protein
MVRQAHLLRLARPGGQETPRNARQIDCDDNSELFEKGLSKRVDDENLAQSDIGPAIRFRPRNICLNSGIYETQDVQL